MVRDLWDRDKSETHYEEYELATHERASLKHIQEQIAQGYTSTRDVREHLNYLEALNKRVQEYLRNEEDMGYANDTLKHDYRRIQTLRQRLLALLDELDQ